MQHGAAHLSQGEYEMIRACIDTWGLWWEDGSPPSRMSPVLRMRGWDIHYDIDVRPFVAIATRVGRHKRLMLRDDAPLSVQAAMMAHTLGHELLGHTYQMDVMVPPGCGEQKPRTIHPCLDLSANAAGALLLIPDRFIEDGLSPREIASWCGVPAHVVARRLTGTLLVDDTPPDIIRIDRRASTRIWEPDDGVTPLRSGGD